MDSCKQDTRILVKDEYMGHCWIPLNISDVEYCNSTGYEWPGVLETITESEDTPTWILYCTVDNLRSEEEGDFTPWLIGVVDNEIDAVRIAQQHIQRYGEYHRHHMHMQRNNGTVEIRKEDNLYRVSDAPLGTGATNA